jgi:GntR family transcriptional regulator of abcA and norABC
VEDDIYRELWLDEMPPPPLKAMDKNGQVLYMGSLSKTLSPGLRIGWVAAPEPVIDRLADLKMQTDYGSSSLSQRVAEKWLSTGLYQKHMERVREQLRIRRNTALNTLDAHLSGLAEWNSPEGGFFIWLKVPSSIPIRSLYRQAILRKLLINPGSIYSDGPNHFIRISYAYASLGELQEGIFILGEEIRKLL